MARHVTRIALMMFVATVATLSGCASAPRPHHLKDVVAEQRQAEQAYEKGDLTQALAGYKALTQTLPGNVDFWFRLGNIHVRMEQPELAATAYEHALRLDPEHAKAWHNLGIVRMREAAAAFAQSAHSAGSNAPELGKVSAQLAHALATLSAPSTESGSPQAADNSVEQNEAPVGSEATP